VLGYPMSLMIMMYCVIGGNATLWGPVLGAFILNIVTELLRVRAGSSFASFAPLVFGIILIVVVRYVPGGLISLLEKATRQILKHFPARKAEAPK